MKKTFIYAILAASVVLIGLGIRGISEDDSDDQYVSMTRVDPTDVRENSGSFQDALSVTIPSGIPSQIKHYNGFSLSFNSDNHTPNWVAWELLGSETEGSSSRSNKFISDPDVEGCPSTSDYSRSGYDRGHMCPAADQKWSEEAMTDCFMMTNMCPQDHSLNSGAWNTLENKERTWARRDSALLIVAGPIYTDRDTLRIGRTGVRVPGAFFKVLAAPYAKSPRGIAFVYPNMSSPGNMENYVMTIDEVEKITGFDFFPSLSEDLEKLVESTTSFKEWNKRN